MQRLVILGGGESGYGTAVLAKAKKYDVFLSDSGSIAGPYREKLDAAGIHYEENGHTEELILSADQVVKSPGIPDDVPIIKKLNALGIPVISEIEFAGRYMKGKAICITGSNGKTTTATLIYEILKEARFDVVLTGNIGDSLALSVANGRHGWYVIELSSFQLDGMKDFKADIAVLMNITPDHLDRYGYKMENYIASKLGIIRNQAYDDYFIYNSDDSNITMSVDRAHLPMRELPFTQAQDKSAITEKGHSGWHGAYVSGEWLTAVAGDRKFVMPVSDVGIKGKHNLYNAMASVLASMAAGAPSEVITKVVSGFVGVEHRMEPAGKIDGVAYINDSKATNTDAAWFALDSMESPVVWIAGGTDKGNDYSTLKPMAKEKVKAMVCLGKDNTKLLHDFRDSVKDISEASSMEEALTIAESKASSGDVVLLSPACASFDLFRNYEDRGTQFKEWIRNHKNNK